MTQEEYSVLQSLPDSGERCLCFGHKTFCCYEDMDDLPEWHEVIFQFIVSSYKLKKEIPVDPEETILENYSIIEMWCLRIEEDDTCPHVIGVTKWKKL